MSKMLYVIVEKRPEGSTVPFYYQVVTENIERSFNPEENVSTVDFINSIFNIESSRMSPPIIYQEEAHVDENGNDCEDICTCGPFSTKLLGDEFHVYVKTHSDFILTFPDEPLKNYLDHLAYNEEHEITIESKFVETDDKFNPI